MVLQILLPYLFPGPSALFDSVPTTVTSSMWAQVSFMWDNKKVLCLTLTLSLSLLTPYPGGSLVTLRLWDMHTTWKSRRAYWRMSHWPMGGRTLNKLPFNSQLLSWDKLDTADHLDDRKIKEMSKDFAYFGFPGILLTAKEMPHKLLLQDLLSGEPRLKYTLLTK